MTSIRKPLNLRLRIIILAVLLLPAIFLSCTQTGFNIYDLQNRRVFPLNKLAPYLAASKMIFIGEFHDQIHHHLAQLSVIRLLHEQDVPLAIGMEMFRNDSQDTLNAWVKGTLDEKDFVKEYYNNWEIPWYFYRPILLYAREHSIPVIGLNIDPGIVEQVAQKGFASLNREQLKQLPGVSCNVNPSYMDFIRHALGMHDTGKEFRFFCEAQMVWDSAMARNLIDFTKKMPERKIIVIAGGGHAWKPGIPSQVLNYGDIALKVILPEISAASKNNISLEETDYLILGI